MNRRTYLGISVGIGVGLSGCTGLLEENESTVSDDDLDPIIVISTPVNADAETYKITITGSLNSADYIEIEYDGQVIHSMNQDYDDPRTIKTEAKKGKLVEAIAFGEGLPQTVEAKLVE